MLSSGAREPHSLGVFRRAFTQAMATRTAKAHLFGHRRAALRARLFARAGIPEILLRLHNYFEYQSNGLQRPIRREIIVGCDYFERTDDLSVGRRRAVVNVLVWSAPEPNGEGAWILNSVEAND